MRVQVQFFSKDTGKPGGRRYTYEGTDALKVGDVVRCGRGKATVVALGSDYDGEVQSIEAVVEDARAERTAQMVVAEMTRLERTYLEGAMNAVAFAEQHDSLKAELHAVREDESDEQ